MKGLKCVIYCRVSSGKQKEEGLSPEIQEERCRNYAEERGMEIKKVWNVDEPATKVGRKAFNQMLVYIQEHKVEHVIVTDLDRLHRNKKDESAIDDLVEAGFSFHYVNENDIYSSDADDMKIFFQELRASSARLEVRRLKKRTHASIHRKLKLGEYCGQAPLGYRNVPKTKGYTAHYVQTDDVHLVKEFLEIFSTGKYTAPEMVEIAEQLGLKSKRGNNLDLGAIKYILKNPTGFYYGEWTYMDYSGKHQGLWEPIVSRKTILRNRAILEKQTEKYQRVTGKEYRFKGLITCSSCGRQLLGEIGSRDYAKKDGTKVAGKRMYYHCNRNPYFVEIDEIDEETGKKKKLEMKCHVPWILETKVEKEMLRNIGLLEFDNDVWKEMRKHLFDTQTKDLVLAELKSLRSKFTQNESIIDKLLRDEIDVKGEAKKNSIRKRRERYEDEQVALEERLAELEIEEQMWNENVEKMIDVVDSMRGFEKKFKEANDRTKRFMIKLMTKQIMYNVFTGNAPVPKEARQDLSFTWCDEFETLFEIGVLKMIDTETEKWDKTNKKKHALPKPKKTKLSSRQGNVDFLFSIS